MKKPDNVVANPASMPYPTNIGAPAFTVPDVIKEKKDRGANASNYFESKFDELKEQYFNLVKQVEDTQLVYSAEYKFIPVVGKVYHLYIGPTNKLFLSLIAPHEWTMEYKGSFRFTSDNIWERV